MNDYTNAFSGANGTPAGGIDGFDAAELCRDLPRERGVAAIPVTAFVDDPEPWRSTLRFAFCKRDEVLDEGVRRLAAQ